MKKFKRVNPVAPRVEFKLPDVYGDAVFELPSNEHVPNGVMRALMRDEMDALFAWFEKQKVDKETLQAIDDLTASELQEFVKAWTSAGVDLPKSSD